MLAAGAFLFWRVRRHGRAPAAWAEAACPACLGLRVLAERVPGMTALVPGLAEEEAAAGLAGSGEGGQPRSAGPLTEENGAHDLFPGS